MRLTALLGLGMAFMLIAADRADKVADVPKDLEKLQGTWTVTKMEKAGKEDKDAVGDTFTVTGDKFVIKKKDGKDAHMEGTLKVDTSKKPATIDMIMKGPDGKEMTMSGLCAIDGDTLKCCMPSEPGKDRPKEISAKDDTMMVTLKKEKK